MATPYVPGMGTHHIRGGITPAMLNDPSFDRLNPILDAAGLDDVFDPTEPEVLQFDGNGPTAKLVGFDYYVRTNTGPAAGGLPGQQRLVAHPPVDLLPQDRRRDDRVQHERRALHVAWAAST